MKDIKIVKVEPTGAPITKGMTYSGRVGFILPVNYTLADGRVIPSSETATRKKDLPNRLLSAQQSAAAGAFSASFGPDGQFFGTSQKFSLGLSGLVHEDWNVQTPETEANVEAVAA